MDLVNMDGLLSTRAAFAALPRGAVFIFPRPPLEVAFHEADYSLLHETQSIRKEHAALETWQGAKELLERSFPVSGKPLDAF